MEKHYVLLLLTVILTIKKVAYTELTDITLCLFAFNGYAWKRGLHAMVFEYTNISCLVCFDAITYEIYIVPLVTHVINNVMINI